MSKDLHYEMREQELAHLLTEVENGNENPLLLYAEIKQLKELYTTAEKQVVDIALDEAEKYPEKSFELDGYVFEKRNGATRYSYKNIPEWQTYNEALKNCEARHKQAFISRQKGLLIASEDGEEIVLPEVNYSKNGLIVKKNATL